MSGTQSDPVLALGRKLVKALDEASARDTLAHWMCHYVAEKIELAEATGTPADRSDAANSILELWQHRSSLPDRGRPLQDFEPLFQTLGRLDPMNPAAWYYSGARTVAESEITGEEEPAADWLSLAESIDRIARSLIRECLAHAAEASGEAVSEWAAAAEAAGLGNDTDLRAVRVLLTGGPFGAEEQERQREHFEKTLKALALFRELSVMLERSIQEQLDQPSGD